MEKKITWYLRRWLGLPQSLNSIALYGPKNTLQVPFKGRIHGHQDQRGNVV